VIPHGEVVVLEERASSRMFIDFVHCTCASGVTCCICEGKSLREKVCEANQ